MKNFLPLLLAVATAISFPAPSLRADSLGVLIFEDDFERADGDEPRDKPGKGWGSNSRTRAAGNKQVFLGDGTMRIRIHEVADHAVSVTQPAEFADGSIGLRFLLEEPQDALGLNFADLECKEVHAGHLFVAQVSPKKLILRDLKTGSMRLDLREARVAGRLGPAEKELIAGKGRVFPIDLNLGEWHDLLVTVEGESLVVRINGKEAGRFESEGVAHPTKRLLRLAVPRNAVVDDVKIWRKR